MHVPKSLKRQIKINNYKKISLLTSNKKNIFNFLFDRFKIILYFKKILMNRCKVMEFCISSNKNIDITRYKLF